MTVHLCGPKDRAPKGAFVINTTSRSTEEWSRCLSPFFLGPVDLYGKYRARNVENAWQYAKVYASMLDAKGDPSPEYFIWAEAGWNSDKAQRYPMGKGAKAEFSYWDGQKLSYVEARKKIYIPLYSSCVGESEAYAKLKEISQQQDIWLWDFDAYDKKKEGMDFDDVINCPTKKMGHAFVLAMMLEGFI